MGWACSNPHQVGQAVRDVPSLSTIPSERIEGAVAPIVLVPSSEQLVFSHGSDPSEASFANPLEDITVVHSIAVMPGVADLQVLDVPGSQSLELGIVQTELLIPDVTVASSEGVFE